MGLNRAVAAAAAIAALAAGCTTVSTSQYRKMQSQDAAQIQQLRQELAADDAKLGVAGSERAKLEGSLADTGKAMTEMQKYQAQAERRLSEYRELTEKLSSLESAGKLAVRIEDGQMIVDLPTEVLFPSGSARLSKDGAREIQQVAFLLAGLSGRKFQVQVHSGSVAAGSRKFPSSWNLASARSLSVVRTMLGSGLSVDRVSAAAFGDGQPAASGDSSEGRALDRRVAIVVVPDLSQLPGSEELNRLAKR